MDSWHFKWINMDSGEIMLDKSGKYKVEIYLNKNLSNTLDFEVKG